MSTNTGAAVADYLRGLTCSQGVHAGEPLEVLEWERQFLEGMFSVEGDAGLTMGRGNGKSTFMAGIGAAAIDPDGPLMEPHADCLVVASSFDQGTVIFRHVKAFLKELLADRTRFRLQDTINHAKIEDRETGARLVVLGSDPARLHGLAPRICLMDEVAQWPRARVHSMLAALRTARGKIPGSKGLWIGTRARFSGHPFEKALQPGGECEFSMSFAAGRDDDAYAEATWRKANPSYDYLPDLQKVLRKEADLAKRDPALLASFKSLRLNQGLPEVDNQDLVIMPALWADILAQPVPDPVGVPVWGIDLGGANAFSSIAAAWANGRLGTLSMCGADPELDKRETQDGAGDAYTLAQAHGELIVSTSRVPKIAHLFEEGLKRFGIPKALICDSWAVPHLRDYLDESTTNWEAIPLIRRRQGFFDGDAAMKAWRKATTGRDLYPVRPCSFLTYALSEAVCVSDQAGNEKLARAGEGGRRSRARDDVVAASLLAIEFRDLDFQPAGGGYGGLV